MHTGAVMDKHALLMLALIALYPLSLLAVRITHKLLGG